MHSNVVKERQKFPWSSRHIEYFSTGLSLAFVQVFSVLFSHFILQPRTIRRARRLCGRKEPLEKIENIGKKPGERGKKAGECGLWKQRSQQRWWLKDGEQEPRDLQCEGKSPNLVNKNQTPENTFAFIRPLLIWIRIECKKMHSLIEFG